MLDRGREFKAEFYNLLKDEYGITRKPITMRNPQVNAMVERVHQTLDNMVRVNHIQDKRDLPNGSWTSILSAIGFAMRATVHTTNQAMPMQLVFGRDAILNVNFKADWQYIKARKQKLICQNDQRENKKRRQHTCHVNDRVYVLQNPTRKHGTDCYRGPWTVVQVNDNGAVKLRQDTQRGGAVYQTWNIRNLTPHKD